MFRSWRVFFLIVFFVLLLMVCLTLVLVTPEGQEFEPGRPTNTPWIEIQEPVRSSNDSLVASARHLL